MTTVRVTAKTPVNTTSTFGQQEGEYPHELTFINGVAETRTLDPSVRTYLERRGFTVEDIDDAALDAGQAHTNH